MKLQSYWSFSREDRLLARGAAPQFVVERVGDRQRRGAPADGLARLVGAADDVFDPAERAGTEELVALQVGVARTGLRADLHEPVVFARRVDHLPPFPDEVRERFLDIHIAPRLARPDDRQRMPILHRRHAERVNVLPLHQLPDIHHLVGPILVFLLDQIRGSLQPQAVRVANGRDSHVLLGAESGDVRRAARAAADDGNADFVVGAEGARAGQHGPRHRRRRGGMLDELSAVNCVGVGDDKLFIVGSFDLPLLLQFRTNGSENQI